MPSRASARLAERDHVLAVGHLAAKRPVVELRLEDDDGIGVADRGCEEALGVGRRGRDHDLDPRRVHVVGLGRVVVELRRAHAAAVRHADRDGELHAAAGAPAVAPDVGDQLVEAGVRERVVLHLADRPPARHAEPDRGTEDPGLRERRVHAAVGAEAVAQAGGRAEDAACTAHVLAHDHDVRVALELDMEAVVDRFHQQPLSHWSLRGCGAARPGRRRARAAGRRTRARRRVRCRRAARPRRPRFRRA